MNILIATQSTALRPKISLKRPHNGWKVVEVRRKADGTQETMAPALNEDEIVGKAVYTMTESMLDTTTHRAKPKNTAMTCRSGRMLVWSVSLCVFGFPRELSTADALALLEVAIVV